MKSYKTLLHAFMKDYEWIHICLGLVGNLLFFVGSVFFLWDSCLF